MLPAAVPQLLQLNGFGAWHASRGLGIAAMRLLRTAAVSAAAQPQYAEAQQRGAEIPVVGGTMLQIRSTNSPVDIRAHSAMDAAVLEFKTPGAWTWASQTADDGRDVINVQEQAGAAGSPAEALTVTIPEKWIGVDVDSRGHPVSVAKVVEANLRVHSHGGDVKLGQIRAYDAKVTTLSPTRCGTLEGQELSGCNVMISTGHAAISLKRLVGQKLDVNLHDRPLRVAALYAEEINLHTGGGDVQIGNLDCSVSAELHTEGGDITVDSLDGHADLHSSGGDIEVHLHSKVGMVRVGSGGGAVRVAVSPQACVEVVVRGSSSVSCNDADEEVDKRTGERVWHFKPQDTANTRYGQLSEGRVIVDAGRGPVEITRVGWMEALKQRLAGKA